MARLEQAYEKTFGGETAKNQLYGGFYVLLAGLLFALVGVALYIFANGQPEPDLWNWRRAAIAVASLSLPLVFFGIHVALPSKRGMRTLSFVGVLLCLVGSAMFLYWYPDQINVGDSKAPGQAASDRTTWVVAVYVLGLAVTLPGTFTSLIGFYVDRITAASATAKGEQGEDMAYGYDVPDSVVEKDIEYAMKKYRYAWGEDAGAGPAGMQINIKDDFDAGTTIGGKGVARTVQLESPQVDEATKVLRGIRPSKDKTVSGEWEADTTKALLAFRAQKKELVAQQAAAKKLGFWARFWAWVTGRRPAGQTKPPQ